MNGRCVKVIFTVSIISFILAHTLGNTESFTIFRKFLPYVFEYLQNLFNQQATRSLYCHLKLASTVCQRNFSTIIEEILTKKNPYRNDDRSLIWAFLLFCFIKISVSCKDYFLPWFFRWSDPVAAQNERSFLNRFFPF